MAVSTQIDPPADDAPYSLENFQWLMENSSAKSFLSAEDLKEIEKALKNRDETTLKNHYSFILEEFAKEREININFALQQESLMLEFTSNVEAIDQEVKTEQKARNSQAEEEEKAGAEDILEELYK